MSEGPTVDNRSREEVLADLRQRAADYTTEWDHTTDDAGTTLMTLFSGFGMDVISRLNDVPDKHRVAFLGALDFDRRPPQSARVPLTFTTTADIEENVVVSGGTQVTAEGEDGGTVIFEIPQEDGFEATAADLDTVASVDPRRNCIFRHDELNEKPGGIRLFTGTDHQSHEFYLGHEELLNLEADSIVTVTMETEDEETLDERANWEYFGENEAGEVGWHHLPRETPDIVEDPFGDDVALEEKMQRVSERVEVLGEGSAEGIEEQLYSPSFRFPGPTAACAIDGTDSCWIRASIPGEEPSDFEIEIESVGLSVEGGTDGELRRPTMVFSNDVPITLEEGDIYPFGRTAQPPTTMYLASEEAFTKKGGAVTIEFLEPEEQEEEDEETDEEEGERLTAAMGGSLSGPPEISWEYWNGDGWIQLGLDSDGTDALQESGEISFSVPQDFQSTSVSGQDDYWIRARLVGGNYGQPEYRVTEDGRRGELVREPDPPLYGDISINYGQHGAHFEELVTHNNESYARTANPEESDAWTEPLRPFVKLPDAKQTLYLGFDAELKEGPINLHIPMHDKAYPREFEPAIRWEYCTDPASWNWEKLDVYDGTEGLTERGIVSISFAQQTEAFELFGQRRHWIRATVTREEFVTAEDNPGGIPTEEEDVALPPTLEAINPNTQWAYNERTVEENLGDSDGSPDQKFECDNVPITGGDVWVDEADSLSAAEKRELEADRPADVEREETAGDDDDEFWVRWEEVPDFLGSSDTARHYLLDSTSGTVTFGDGQEGKIPPSGDENVRAIYRTGGGSEGNVDADSITDLRSSISRVDEVTNRKPSDGGTDVESLDEAASRAPEQLKNRGKAVTADDFEQIARESSRQLAKVKCEPEMDESGGRTPGWVTLLIIPRERRDRPTPSLELRQRVREAVSECAPATLVGTDAKRVVVRGPDYAEVSIETTVRTEAVESITNLKNTIEGNLESFFHPLNGGRDGEGWEFGTAPQLHQVTTLIEEVSGVNRVRDIAMTIETATEEKIIRDPEKQPLLARDELISNGTHDVSIIMRGQR